MVQAGKMRETASKALISLGSNVTSRHGGPVETVLRGLDALESVGVREMARSGLYLTPFVPVGGGADVVNAAAVVETDLSPAALLARLHEIEAAFDRERAVRWGDRTLDVDLILMGDVVLPDWEGFLAWQGLAVADRGRLAPDRLVLPHPRMAERAFVLVPAAEVAAGWRHPVFGETVRDLCAALPEEDLRAVRPLDV